MEPLPQPQNLILPSRQAFAHVEPSAMPLPSTFRKLSILVAAYNEEETLATCLEAVRLAPLPAGLEREIVLVEDGSKDGTWEVARQLAAAHPEIRIFQQPHNMGKGAALRRAIEEMTGD